MAKLIFFIVLLTALASVAVLSNYKGLEIDNENFASKEENRLSQIKKEEEERLAAIEAAKKAAMEPKKVELVLDTPELKNGHEVYFKKGKCITCHGRKGEGKKSQQAPKLAAQHDWYIYSTLNKVKTGERVVAKMKPYLKGLSDQDFKDVSLYLSQLEAQ